MTIVERVRALLGPDAVLEDASAPHTVPRIAPAIRVERAGIAERTQSARPPVRPSAPLARFGDGSLRGAVILSEVLGRPLSDR